MPLDIPVAIAMVVVGTQYWSEEYCKIELTTEYLVLAGSIYICLSFLRYIGFALDKTIKWKRLYCFTTILLVEVLVHSATLIWGTYGRLQVFKKVDHDDTWMKYYCNYVPYSFQTAMLIIGWTILGPILFVSGCFIVSALIVGILYGFWKIIETPLHALDNWMGSR